MIRTLNDLERVYRLAHILLLIVISAFGGILYTTLWQSDKAVNTLLMNDIIDPITACADVNCSYIDIGGLLYQFSSTDYDISKAPVNSVTSLPYLEQVLLTTRHTNGSVYTIYTRDHMNLAKLLLTLGLPLALLASLLLGLYVESKLAAIAADEVANVNNSSDRESDLKALIAATAHHEMLAPIAIIKTGIRKLCHDLGISHTQTGPMKLISASICRLEAVLIQMSKDRKTHAAKDMAVYEIVSDTLESLTVLYTEVNFRYTIANEGLLRAARCYKLCPGTISNILNNLFKNALEAGATELTVACAFSGKYIDLFIMDNGTGVPGGAEVINKVFDMGYSNKNSDNLVTANKKLNVDKDTRGNGLYLAKTILISTGGDIVLVKTGSKGTMFKMCLPYKAIGGDCDY